MCRFRVGDKVVCINDSPGFKHPQYKPPFKNGDVCVVADISDLDDVIKVDADSLYWWSERRFAPIDRLLREHIFEITCTLPESVDERIDEPVKTPTHGSLKD